MAQDFFFFFFFLWGGGGGGEGKGVCVCLAWNPSMQKCKKERKKIVKKKNKKMLRKVTKYINQKRGRISEIITKNKKHSFPLNYFPRKKENFFTIASQK